MDEKTKAAWAATALRMANDAARECGIEEAGLALLENPGPVKPIRLETIVMIWPESPKKGKK